MTLLPVEPIRVTIPPQDGWVEPEQSYNCCNPECNRNGMEGHHVVRRSETGGPKDWIAVDGLVLFNKLRVCNVCHCDLTEHRTWIRYFTGAGWLWYAAVPGGERGPREDFIQHPKSGRWFRLIGPVKGV